MDHNNVRESRLQGKPSYEETLYRETECFPSLYRCTYKLRIKWRGGNGWPWFGLQCDSPSVMARMSDRKPERMQKTKGHHQPTEITLRSHSLRSLLHTVGGSLLSSPQGALPRTADNKLKTDWKQRREYYPKQLSYHSGIWLEVNHRKVIDKSSNSNQLEYTFM